MLKKDFPKVLVLLLEIFFGIKFNLVGTISLSELALVFGSFWYIKSQLFREYPILRKISYLYLGLLLSQILSEIILGNQLSNSVKAYAITIVSYLHFMLLFYLFIKDRKLVIYAIIGMVAKNLIFGSEFEGNVEEVLEGEGATFLKFYLAPIIINCLLIFSVFFNKKSASLICVFTGLLFVILGARSSGVSIFLTGLIAYILLSYKGVITRSSIIAISSAILLIGTTSYVWYVNEVLAGRITSGNSWQLKETENPYNPIYLFMMGRTEAFVGWVAFMDKPLFGHGAWAQDPGWKYHILVYKFRNAEYKSNKDSSGANIIPSHSVLIGSGVQNGVLAFVLMLMINFFFLKSGLKDLKKNKTYLLIVIYFNISLIWTVLFSPNSHFRQTLPLYFAFLLTISISIDKKKKYLTLLKNNKKLYETKNISSYSNSRTPFYP